jgi:predicted amidohydrolase YtcJ
MRLLSRLISSGLSAAGIRRPAPSPSSRGLADLVLMNGVIWTVDPARPRAEAVAIGGANILRVGSNADIRALTGPETRVVDMRGRLLLPGFIDAHTHFLDGGFSLSALRLRDAGSRREFIDRVATRARGLKAGEWIRDGGWDHQSFERPELPRREWIDDVTPDHPVCLSRFDLHMVLVNSLALKRAGITLDTPDPAGGEIVRDPVSGDPTGILKDEAMKRVLSLMPDPTPEEKRQAALAAVRHAHEHGITSVHDMSNAQSFQVYRQLLHENRLGLRLYVYHPIAEVDSDLRFGLRKTVQSDRLKLAGLKGFVDGSLGSFTALFFDPYNDDPSKTGLLSAAMFPEGIMEKRLQQAERAGLQVAVHAIGDRANHIILDLYEKIFREHGERDRRWRIEHAQHLASMDLPRFKKLGVLASVQPGHAADDGRWAITKIGPERLAEAYPFRSLIDSGARLVFGSDWTVAPLDPIDGIHAAVTRRTLDGKNPGGWVPEEKISLEDAVRGYTINAAFAEFSETVKGSITPGKLADLVLLDRNLFEIPSDEINKTRVEKTVLDGEVVFERGP